MTIERGPHGGGTPGSRFRCYLLIALMLTALPAVGQRMAETPEQAYAGAYRAYSQQMYPEAVAGFTAFRARYPEHLNVAEALYYEAQATLAMGDEEQSVALFEQFHERYPGHPLAYEARLALGKYFYDSTQYERSIEILQSVLDDAPTSEVGAKAYYWMAEAAMKLDRPDDATAWYLRAQERYSGTSTAPRALLAAAFVQTERSLHEDAARTFELLSSVYPDSPYSGNVGLALAEVYYDLGKYQEALNEAERRFAGLSGFGQDRATFLMAESYNHLGQTEQAVAQYQRFTEASSENGYYRPALFGLGWTWMKAGNYENAARTFARLRHENTDTLAQRGTYHEAVSKRLAGDRSGAISTFDLYLKQWPQGVLAEQARLEKALTYYELEDWTAATRAFDDLAEAHARSEELPRAYQLQAGAYIAIGNYASALQAFDRSLAIRNAPASLRNEIQFERAWMLYRSGAYSAAGPAFLAMAQQKEAHPRAAEALFWAAESHFQMGDYRSAEQIYQEYRSRFKQGRHAATVQYALGWVYFKQRRWDDAVAAFEQFLASRDAGEEFQALRSNAALRLGDSYLELRRYPDAVRAYEQVSGTGRDYARYQLGQAHLSSGSAIAARRAFESVIREFPRSEWIEEAQYAIGYLLFNDGNYDGAIEAYQQLIRRSPRDVLAARAQFEIGNAHYNAGRFEEAATAYRRVLDRYESSPYAAEATAGIQQMLIEAAGAEAADTLVAEFLRSNPDAAGADEIRFREAEKNYQSGRLRQALDAFASFTKETRSQALLPDAYYYQGAILADMGNDQAAIPMLRRVMDAYQNSRRYLDASRRLGTLYLDRQSYSEALAVFRGLESGARDDDYATLGQARYGQSLALLGLDRTEEAEEILKELIAEAPENPDLVPAMLGLARVYDYQGLIGEATEQYRTVVRLSHDVYGAEAQYRLGLMYLTRGDPGIGVEELGRVATSFAAYPEWVAGSFLVHARLLRDMGQIPDSDRLYRRIITDYGQTAAAGVAKRERGSN